MRIRSFTKILGFLILVTFSCIGVGYLFMTWLDTGFWGWPYHGSRLRLVEREMENTVAELPQPDSLQLLATQDEIFSSHIHVPKKIQSKLREEGEPPCYYASRWLLYGTQLTKEDVITYFVEELVLEGWLLVELSGHGRLTRGTSESVFIAQAWEHSYFYHNVGIDYHQVKEEYGELISIQVEYIWPKRAGC